MDVQMPEMGGFEATVRIRDRGQQNGKRLPIIAVTANAMKGDGERCLAAGMEGYISKPITAPALFREIDEILDIRSQHRDVDSVVPTNAVLDVAARLERTGGNMRWLGEMAALFLAECPRRMEAMRDAIARQDAADLEHTAHAIFGTAPPVGVVLVKFERVPDEEAKAEKWRHPEAQADHAGQQSSPHHEQASPEDRSAYRRQSRHR